MHAAGTQDEPQARRKAWMGVLARAGAKEMQAIVDALPNPPEYGMLKPPEVGSVMIEGRTGGVGRRFNLGEASVTRCVVRLADGTAGFSYALGRDLKKAELAAVLDALLQGPEGRALEAAIIAPLAAAQAEKRSVASSKAAATKVEFFTMVRGE